MAGIVAVLAQLPPHTSPLLAQNKARQPVAGLAQQFDYVMLMTDSPNPTDTRVLYNETCPVCRFEIDGYRRSAAKDNLPIRFDGMGAAADWGLTPDQAARRLHVIHQGQLLSGIPAFLALWSAMPRWRWLARLVAVPGIHGASCLIYDHVMAPILYRAHLRRQGLNPTK